MIDFQNKCESFEKVENGTELHDKSTHWKLTEVVLKTRKSSCDAFALKPFIEMPESDTNILTLYKKLQFCYPAIITDIRIGTINKLEIQINLGLQYILWPEKLQI